MLAYILNVFSLVHAVALENNLLLWCRIWTASF